MQVTQIYAHFAPAYDQDIEKLTIQTANLTNLRNYPFAPLNRLSCP